MVVGFLMTTCMIIFCVDLILKFLDIVKFIKLSFIFSKLFISVSLMAAHAFE